MFDVWMGGLVEQELEFKESHRLLGVYEQETGLTFLNHISLHIVGENAIHNNNVTMIYF
jgi:hypothetical protein